VKNAMNSRFNKHCIALVSGCLALTMLSGCSQFGNLSGNSANEVSTGKAPERVYSTRTAPLPSTRGQYTEDVPEAPVLVDNYPNSYTVVRGDTLWDISARFLRDPWLWPEVWQVNEQIINPHLIYPGDVITLVWVDGKPQLRLGSGSVRLGPKVRYEDLGNAIPTIPFDAISAFLAKPTVLDRSVADSLPYILASADGRLVMSEGNKVYARGNINADNTYNVMHIGDPYFDPETNFIFGYEATNVGEGTVVRMGDPATIDLTDSNREILRGDRLLSVDPRDVGSNYYPLPAPSDLDGSIISVVDGVAYIGQYDIIVLNRGANAGLEDGSVVSIYQRGDLVADPYAQQKQVSDESRDGLVNNLKKVFSGGGGNNNLVKLPDEPAGEAMVFRTYESISYALVMRAVREIHEGDRIRTPD